ncbi:MAG: signal transduction histidine kinase LytS [Bacteroidetes bacterium]|jgi:LytS/YehU family sensor histidine kinase|nr:signal transduction histidine kinase LytS [Bacteroidota bacterium]
MNSQILIIILLFILLAAFAVLMAVKYLREKDKKTVFENKYKELEMKVHGLELESIKYKLNPHLFKNVLNSIQSHAYQTYYSLDKLANVLDYILYETDQGLVSLKEETEFALNLIEINRLKISPLFDLRIKNKVEPNEPLYEQKLIAPLITVDLIENAFKHADLQSPESFISVVFEFKDNKFFLTVSNKISQKPAFKKEKGGFGKENFKKRLDIIYKENYTFDQFVEKDIYIAHLKIDLLEHKAKMLAIG